MIGNVGGTLGLFIGFSFTNLISYFLNSIYNFVTTMTNQKIQHQVILVSNNPANDLGSKDDINQENLINQLQELKKEFELRFDDIETKLRM